MASASGSGGNNDTWAGGSICTALWLHNKLGTGNEFWSGGSICSQLNQDVLRNIKECFIDLQAQVKLKLLLSFLHIPRRNVDEWKVELEDILELAVVDSDQWVSMLAELLKLYPSSGNVNMEIEENARVFTDLLTELKKLVKKHSDLGMLPMECLYLNKNALTTVVGQQPQPTKHFTLKRKPKSAALRAELLQKSNDAAINLKKNVSTPSVPVRSRSLAKKMDDTTPLKGLPSRTPTNVFRSPPTGIRRLNSTPVISTPSRALPKTPAGRKDGGIKFLEITEQPIGFGREAKRRKKLPDEAGESFKKEKETPAGSSPTTPSTPEYAVGLVSTSNISPTALPATPTTPLPSLSTNNTGTANFNPTTPVTAGVVANIASLSNSEATVATVAPATPAFVPISTGTAQARENLQTTTGASRVIVTQVTATSSSPGIIASVSQSPTTANGASVAVASQQAAVNTSQQIQVQQPQQRRGLSLTREQMQEAQEMFKSANKVTRPEKALILGFMAGARDNPCPHLGNIVTIKLSENVEFVSQPDGTDVNMMAEIHFQMNYNTGEWKRVKKLRKLEE